MSALAWYALSHVDNHDPQAIVWVLGDPNKSSDASTARAWVAAIVDGVPVARGDRIARIGDVSTVLHEMLSEHGNGSYVRIEMFAIDRELELARDVKLKECP